MNNIDKVELEGHFLNNSYACITIESKTVSPVILTVPHDGLPKSDFSGIFRERETGFKGRDSYVWPVAKDIIIEYRASVVRGQMPRAFIDYNRSWPVGINYYPKTQKEVHTALDDTKLVKLYKHYHSEIDRLVRKSKQMHGKNCLLLDLHGFSKQPPYSPNEGFDLIFGTGNRLTIHYGDIDIRLASFMKTCGYEVFYPKKQALDRKRIITVLILRLEIIQRGIR